jgi:uncharacterized protein YraI
MRHSLALLLAAILLTAAALGEVGKTTRKNNYIREGPGSYFDLVTVVPDNTSLEILERSGQWVKVKLPAQKSGWIAANSLTSKKGGGTPPVPVETVMASAKASKAGISAAIKGFGDKYSGTSEQTVEQVVKLGDKPFRPEDLSMFMNDLRRVPSSNRGKGSWESLGLKNARIDPRLSDQSVGLSIASRIAGRGLLQDMGLHTYVNLIAATIAAASPLYDWDLNVYVLQDEESHAYAVPGGYIFLSMGMVSQCRDEAELAALIGHEIGVMITSFAIQEPTERSTMNAIDEAFKELDEETEKLEEERAGVEAFVDKTYKKVIGPRDSKTTMDADRIAVVLCANAGYDPFAAANIAGFTKGGRPSAEEDQEEEVTVPADTRKRQDAIKSYCAKRFVSKNPGATMAERFTEKTQGMH